MNFQEAVRTCLTKYATFTGRAVRSEFWWFALAVFVASVILSYLSSSLSLVFSLATLVPSLAAGARRLHDTNRSGWWQLIGLIPVIGWIILIVMFAQDTKSESTYGVAA